MVDILGAKMSKDSSIVLELPIHKITLQNFCVKYAEIPLFGKESRRKSLLAR